MFNSIHLNISVSSDAENRVPRCLLKLLVLNSASSIQFTNQYLPHHHHSMQDAVQYILDVVPVHEGFYCIQDATNDDVIGTDS